MRMASAQNELLRIENVLVSLVASPEIDIQRRKITCTVQVLQKNEYTLFNEQISLIVLNTTLI